MLHHRRAIVHVLIVTLLLAAIFVSALPALAQGGVTVVANDNLNLRASPNTGSAVLGRVPFETELPANFLSSDRNWVAVVYNGQGGWLSLAFTGVVDGSLAALPISDQTFTAGGGGQVTSSVVVAPTINLRYRHNPTLDERPAGAIPWQTQVPALALSSDSLFVLVNYNGENVWVYREYVTEVQGSLNSFVPGAPPVAGGAAPAPAAPTGDVAIGSTVTGTINDAQTFVNYSIYLNAGDVVTLTMERASGNLDPLLRLFNPGGNEVAMNDDINLQGGNLNARIANYTAGATGMYRISAQRFGGTLRTGTGQLITNTTGDFRLTVSGQAAAPAPAAPPPAADTGAAAPTGARAGVFVAVDGTSNAHVWNSQLPGDLASGGFGAARIIAYVRENLHTIQTCDYVAADGRPFSLNRVRVEYIVRLVNAETGATLDERSYSRDADACPGSFMFNSGLQSIQPGPPPIEDALGWFREWNSR